MKRILLVSVLSALALTADAGIALQYCDGTEDSPCLVQDTPIAEFKPKFYRDTAMISNAYSGDINGLSSLWLSGSEMLSASGWGMVKNAIQLTTHDTARQILDIDLRQESHGYLNGNAITLAVIHDWVNLNKSDSEVAYGEASFLNDLRSAKEVINVLTPIQFDIQDYKAGKTVSVDNVKSEETQAREQGFQYFRMNITDHQKPSDASVDNLISLIDNLPENTWIHVHCRGGKGRTTTVMAMLDMLKNADKVSFNDILARQSAVPPFYNLASTTRSDPDLSIYYIERYQFLDKFYQYAIRHIQGNKEKWSVWKKEDNA